MNLVINCELFFCISVVACSLTVEEILEDWKWLEDNVMATLKNFEKEEDVTNFVCCKVQSVIANNVPDNQFADGNCFKEGYEFKSNFQNKYKHICDFI